MHSHDFRYVPFSSANPLLEELALERPRFVIYNKSDLADPDANKVPIIVNIIF